MVCKFCTVHISLRNAIVKAINKRDLEQKDSVRSPTESPAQLEPSSPVSSKVDDTPTLVLGSSQTEKPKNSLLKIVLTGYRAPGISSLLTRYVTGEFQDSLTATIGMNFMQKNVDIGDVSLKLQIWGLLFLHVIIYYYIFNFCVCMLTFAIHKIVIILPWIGFQHFSMGQIL